MENNKMASEEPCNAATRIGNYPAVQSAISQASGIYTQVKESNGLVKYTLETAESVTSKVSEKAVPLVTGTLDGKLDTINNIACSQLDKLEEKYPIITKPTDEVLDTTKKIYDNSSLKPAVEAVSTVTKYSVNTVTSIKDYSLNTATGIKDYGVESAIKMKDYSVEKLSDSLKTPIGQKVAVKLDYAMNMMDDAVDYYLPGPENAEDKTESGEMDTITHAAHLSNKLRTRLYSKTVQDIESIKKQGLETLEKFKTVVDLINYLKLNDIVHSGLETTKQKFMKIYEEINREELDASTDNITLERRLILVARRLAQDLKKGMVLGKETASGIPESLSSRFEQGMKYMEEMYESLKKIESFEDFTKIFMAEVQTKMGYLQNTLLELAELTKNSLQQPTQTTEESK